MTDEDLLQAMLVAKQLGVSGRCFNQNSNPVNYGQQMMLVGRGFQVSLAGHFLSVSWTKDSRWPGEKGFGYA